MTPFSGEAQTLFKLLSDRAWHEHSDIKERLARTVAPGKALRKYEDRIERRRELNSNAPMVTPPDQDEKIRFGQRLIADRVIQGLKRKYLEFDSNGGGFGRRMLRLKPEVEIPVPLSRPLGATETVVQEREDDDADLDPAEAEEPAESPAEDVVSVADPVLAPAGAPDPEAALLAEGVPAAEPFKDEVALFSEPQVRRMIAEEVGKQLDGFQTGMQVWLSGLLSDLDHRCLLKELHGPQQGFKQ